VWLVDTARGVRTRSTTDPAGEYNPIWSPDGRRIVFDSWRTGTMDLYEKPVAGDATETLLLASPEPKFPCDWSPDGRFILYVSRSATAGGDLWALPLAGDRKPVPVAHTPFEEWGGHFSPDGHWIAYQSNASGQDEIYVQPFPGPGGRVQISTAGGTSPVWPRDGRELFFLANGRVMAAPVTGNGARVGTPVPLFTAPPASSTFDVTADGQRFLFNIVVKEASPITILMNWKPAPREAR
jgi:Tol biopolymer transport system component